MPDPVAFDDLTTLTTLVDADDFLVNEDQGDGTYVTKRISKANLVTALGIGDALPVSDATAVVKGSTDATKLIRLEADGLTTGTTRVLTPPDADITLPGINIPQTWAGVQTFTLAPVFTDASGTRAALGLGTAAVQNVGAFLQPANNLSDLASATTARTNLGLGTAALKNTGASGDAVGLLNTANTHSGLATFTANILVGSGAAAGVVTATAPASGAGNNLALSAASAVTGNTAGGSVTLTPGVKSGSGADGVVCVKAATTTPAATLLEIQTSAGTARLLAGTAVVAAGLDAYYWAVKPSSREYRFGAYDAAGSLILARSDSGNGLMVQPNATDIQIGTVLSATALVFNTASAASGPVVFTPGVGGGTGVVQFGRRFSDSSAGVGATVQLWTNTGQTAPAITVLAPGGASGALFDVMPSGLVRVSGTVTAGGVTGNQTINKPCGTVNFAAAATSLVVTNSLVTASSIVLATVLTNDGTLKSVAAVPAAGSFTLHANAAATAETKVGFVVINVL